MIACDIQATVTQVSLITDGRVKIQTHTFVFKMFRPDQELEH